MAFDALRGKLLVFGGNGSGLLNDTWEYDPRAGAWQEATVTGVPPGPRQRPCDDETVMVAEWIINKKGILTMDDYLDF